MSKAGAAVPAHRLLPEWHRQWGVMIAWPHDGTDWQALLPEAEQTYLELSRAILARESLLVLCRDEPHADHIRALLTEAGADISRVRFLPLPYNDTWTRDYGPLAISNDSGIQLLDFTFNGWGNKFAADRDNRVSGQLPWRVPLDSVDLVLEGGSLDTDGAGTLLTTRHCLLNPNRNPALNQAALEIRLREHLGLENILWLTRGELEGDDTDAHVDTLARFCNETTIAYVQCGDEQDSHYVELQAMEVELQRLAAERELTLVPLPLPPAIHDEHGQRLPATYANFLIINDAVLVPVYGADTDEIALTRLHSAFPNHAIEPVNCRSLIHQHGSLHCVTMQLPEGVL